VLGEQLSWDLLGAKEGAQLQQGDRASGGTDALKGELPGGGHGVLS
jgi:hypothetical protein